MSTKSYAIIGLSLVLAGFAIILLKLPSTDTLYYAINKIAHAFTLVGAVMCFKAFMARNNNAL